MINIFSSFNPLNFFISFFLLINFLIVLNNILFFNEKLFSKFSFFLRNLFNFINNDFNKVNNSKLSLRFLIIIFIFNIILNLINIFPYSFCFNSQINIFIFIRLLIWLSCILYSCIFFFYEIIFHLTPRGCPLLIRFFIVVIEFIRIIIRPITLGVRISANLISGHLLIHLLTEFSFFLFNLNFIIFILSLIFILILTLLELRISIIQSYIFCTLINIYLCENSNYLINILFTIKFFNSENFKNLNTNFENLIFILISIY